MSSTNRSNDFGPCSGAPTPRGLCLAVSLTIFAVSWIGSVDSVHARALAAQQAARAAKTVWSGVYTDQQAARGKAVYDVLCSHCHGSELDGADAPPLVGSAFLRNWLEDDLSSLFRLVHDRMPGDAPGVLTNDASADVTSYLLRANGFPSGPEELEADMVALSAIRIEGKNGPAPVPDSALVLVVGCLTQSSNAQWMLTRATEALRTREPAPDSPESGNADKPLGTQTFSLMDVALSHPDAHRNKKVAVKGLLIRRAGGAVLNVTSLQDLSSTCPM